MLSSFLKNRGSSLDLILGLRGWGLILYGSLPANLALLGTLEVKLGSVAAVQRYLLPVSLLPVFVTFLLIRSRHRDWYLTTDRLKTRSVITTALIVVCASLISGASGILHGRYTLAAKSIFDQSRLLGTSEAYLFGVASLVISSTLFMAVLSKGSDLPGLPTAKFVDSLSKMRSGLRQVQTSDIWDWSKYAGKEGVTGALRGQLLGLRAIYTELDSHPGNKLAKSSLGAIDKSLQLFQTVVAYVEPGEAELKERNWKVFFAPQAVLSDGQLADRNERSAQYAAVEHIRSLRLGE